MSSADRPLHAPGILPAPASSPAPSSCSDPALGALRRAITAATRADEAAAVAALLDQAAPVGSGRSEVAELARRLVGGVRERRRRASGVDALMQEFSLSSQEGIALMCLAEALLRIPDAATRDRLIADKIGHGDWQRHLGESPSMFVNAAAWGLMITGKLVAQHSEQGLGAALGRLLARGGEPLIRKGVDMAMRLLGDQFVLGQNIMEALQRSRANEARGYRYSYDMLGEAALTAADAQRYFEAYRQAIKAIGRHGRGLGWRDGPGISVKLSALHPRYSRAQKERVMAELLPRLKTLALLASECGIGINIDAEEAERLELSLDLLQALAFDPDLSGYEGLGFVVQAYQKRCQLVIDWLLALARASGRRLMVRLVKGAYWDAEIKRAQVDGLAGYPVFTRKCHTDVSYLACADKLLRAGGLLYPQFATHNAHTLAAIYHRAHELAVEDYEFQCLHGMGEALYDQVVGHDKLNKPCRIYAPVGTHETLLAYLVRRLLENGANASFVHRVVDEAIPIERLVADPVQQARASGGAPHPAIPLPADLFGAQRKNSAGLDLASDAVLAQWEADWIKWKSAHWQAAPLMAQAAPAGIDTRPVLNPADRRDSVGMVVEAALEDVHAALAAAQGAVGTWQAQGAHARAQVLLRAADLFEAQRCELMALAVREAGKTVPNALGEVREAVDYLRYYARQIEVCPPGPPLGVAVCISPWNFPLAIFTGQVAAALACGNAVVAKPAEQTPLIAQRALELLHQAGVPRAALQCLPGRGETVGEALVADRRVAAVLFTGSTAVARSIHRLLSGRANAEGREIALIAETGGQNALIVDSSALPEQVVQDVITSAFDSAGQRCSALRVLCLQEDIAERTLELLQGAMAELSLGDPAQLCTDVGPVIDAEARQALLGHLNRMRSLGHALHTLAPEKLHHASLQAGTFVAPTLVEIDRLSDLEGEVFGPVLHVLRYERARLPALVADINASGFGLTMGIHSRIDETVAAITASAHVGNVYVNRNMVGAVVGVQPFGGEGQSGTGPKAGGPLYLKRMQQEQAPGAALDAEAAGMRWQQRPSAPAALEAVAAWARQQGRAELARLCQDYAGATLFGGTLLLPGPTGERNTLSFCGRGSLWCAGPGVDGALAQLAAALATGNRALLARGTLEPLGLPEAVLREVDWLAPGEEGRLSLQAALAEPAAAAAVRIRVAARPGALVPVLVAEANAPFPLWRLLAERAMCINTTAAGGNASLMAMEQ